MRGPPAGPRVLLRRLREIMAEPISAQDRLDKIVTQIAANMVAEVCSVYVLRSDGSSRAVRHRGPEARSGPPRDAAHRPGACRHHRRARRGRSTCPTPRRIRPSAICRRPARRSTHSFLGVPILRAGRTLGVLVVQNRAHRTYSDEEVEALADHRHGPGRNDRRRRVWRAWRGPARSLDLKRPITVSGVGLCEGVGLGHVVLHEPRVVVTDLIAEDVGSGSGTSRCRRSPACGCSSTTCCHATTSAITASTATCSRPIACSPTTAAGCGGCTRRSATA